MRTIKELLSGWRENIRNTKISRGFPVYEIEKAEKRYEAMAAKGWLLRKQGRRFDWYRKGEAKRLQYRIEYCPVKAFDGIQDMSEEQVNFYEECGWTLVSERRGVYVFSAPEDSEPMELYSDPQEQIRMLKSIRNYIGSFSAIFICCFVDSILGRALAGQHGLLSLEALYAIDWILFFVTAALVYVIWEEGYGVYRCQKLVRRVKKGKPIHHLPGEKQPKHRAAKCVKAVLLTLMGICAVGSIAMWAGKTEIPLSEVGGQPPYLLAQEVYEGERSDRDIFGREEENSVTHVPALMADYYEVSEYLTDGDGDFVSLDQNLYLLRADGERAVRRGIDLARSLLEGSIFGADGSREIEHDAFDYAASAQYALVAVKGNRVIRVTCIASSELEKDWMEVLDKLADKWG